MRVLSVAAEAFPLLKTGGLADVVGALPGALAPAGVAVTTLLPGHPAILGALQDAQPARAFDKFYGGPAQVLRGRAAGMELLVLDAPHLFARPGNPYVGPDGRDWPDNAVRFAALARLGAILAHEFDIVHAHDWHAGLLPAFLQYDNQPHPPCVFTIHNLAFTGAFDLSLLRTLGLPDWAGDIHGVEFKGGLSFLKAGLRFATAVTTVSPTYAAEIRTAGSGMGFDGLLRDRGAAVHGILNGIDTAVWDPATDPLIAARYSAADLAGRVANKRALQERLGLRPDPDALVFGAVSRLTEQKGFDLLIEALPVLTGAGAQLAMLGSGDPGIESAFRAAAAAQPGTIGVQFGYDEALAHLIQAGCDALLVPSRFEPCGLTQLCALRYGAVPLVARTGGLADTVIDANEAALAIGTGTGLQFSPVTAEMLAMAIRRCADLWADRPLWARLMANAMASPVSWERPAKHYAALYRSLLS